MGGNAFAAGPDPLDTPRMPFEIYERVRKACFGELRKLFELVKTPIPGPEKSDYGDVDFIVASPIGLLEGYESSGRALVDKKTHSVDIIAWAIKAARVKPSPSPYTEANFAIPWPEHEDELDKIRDRVGSPPPFDAPSTVHWLWRKRRDQESGSLLHSNAVKQYVQVDVRVCESKTQLEWLNFRHSHGDFWVILGQILRQVGLVLCDKGLSVKIPQIEPQNRKLSRIFLTDEPAEVMDILGFSLHGFCDDIFPSERAMFDYIAKCRFFWLREAADQTVETTVNKNEQATDVKARDLRTMRSHPVVHRWYGEYLPSLQGTGLHRTEPAKSREGVLKEMLDRFGVHGEYEARLKPFLEERRRLRINELIRSAVPAIDAVSLEPKAYQLALQHRSCLIKALNQILVLGDETYGVVRPEGFEKLGDSELAGAVGRFIEKNRKDIGDAALARSKARGSMARKAKAEQNDAGEIQTTEAG